MTRKEHRAEMKKMFERVRAQWVDEVMTDPELDWENNASRIARARDRLVPPRRRKRFNEFLRYTGAGDHPEFLRLMLEIADVIEPKSLVPKRRRPARRKKP